MTAIFAFILILIIKFIMNITAFFQCNSIQYDYHLWLAEKDDPDLYKSKAKIKKLMDDAGLGGRIIPVVEPAGYGQLLSMNVPVFDQFPSRRSDFAIAADMLMSEAKGVYKTRALESFSPLFWIKFLIFLPKNIVSYIGLNADTALARLLQVAWWAASTLLFVIYQDEVSAYVKTTINNIKGFF